MTIPSHQVYRIAKGKSLVTLLLSTYPIRCTRRYSIKGDEPRQQSQLFMFPSDHIVERLFSIFASERNVSWCQKTEKPYFSAIQTLFTNNNYTTTPVCISETSWSTVNICLRKRPKNQGYRVCDTLRNPKDLNRGDQLPSM